jgi:hypothetical protein
MNKKHERKQEILVRLKKLREKLVHMPNNSGVGIELVDILIETIKLLET